MTTRWYLTGGSRTRKPLSREVLEEMMRMVDAGGGGDGGIQPTACATRRSSSRDGARRFGGRLRVLLMGPEI